jgi:hypothetical protein
MDTVLTREELKDIVHAELEEQEEIRRTRETLANDKKDFSEELNKPHSYTDQQIAKEYHHFDSVQTGLDRQQAESVERMRDALLDIQDLDDLEGGNDDNSNNDQDGGSNN